MFMQVPQGSEECPLPPILPRVQVEFESMVQTCVNNAYEALKGESSIYSAESKRIDNRISILKVSFKKVCRCMC